MKIDLDDRAIEAVLDRLDGSGSDDERDAVTRRAAPHTP